MSVQRFIFPALHGVWSILLSPILYKSHQTTDIVCHCYCYCAYIRCQYMCTHIYIYVYISSLPITPSSMQQYSDKAAPTHASLACWALADPKGAQAQRVSLHGYANGIALRLLTKSLPSPLQISTLSGQPDGLLRLVVHDIGNRHRWDDLEQVGRQSSE
jgi:hypothetical protein